MSSNKNTTNAYLTLSDDTVIRSIDEALSYINEAEEKINYGALELDDEYTYRQYVSEIEEWLGKILPLEAIKMIELAKGNISSNYSLRTSFLKIIQVMANFCPEQISLLPKYQ